MKYLIDIVEFSKIIILPNVIDSTGRYLKKFAYYFYRNVFMDSMIMMYNLLNEIDLGLD